MGDDLLHHLVGILPPAPPELPQEEDRQQDSIQAEPRHYAGLALLKLADNFENHVAIAQEGGIQALLRLGRERTTDEELQYKAALTVGNLASNAVKLLPRRGMGPDGDAKANESASRRGKEKTTEYLDRSTQQ